MVMKQTYLTFNLSIVTAILLSACGVQAPSVPVPPTPSAAAVQTQPVSSVVPYFTDPGVRGSHSPTRVLLDAILSDINSARNSIDVAMYNFTMREIGDALIKASQRGVAVRVVVDSDTLEKLDLSRMKQAGIYVLGDRRESLMHNKFLLIDGRILWTGSLNFSAYGAENDENVFARLESEELAANYRLKFDEMFIKDRFGADSRRMTNTTRFNLDGSPVENFFSPEDEIDSRLVKLVNDADDSVHVLAYSFTLNRLADALINADRDGVDVSGVFDEESSRENQGADFFQLQKAGLNVRLDGSEGLMHIKAIIVDGETVAFGSYNFTASAENRNDENVLIITDPTFAAEFEEAFERIYARAQ